MSTKSKNHGQLLTKSSALLMVYLLREAFNVVAEVAEVEEDIGNCDELLEREFIIFILRP